MTTTLKGNNQMGVLYAGLAAFGVCMILAMSDLSTRATERRKAIQQEQGPRGPHCKHSGIKEGAIVRILPSEKKGVVVFDPGMHWAHGHLVSYVDNEGRVREAHLQDSQIAIVSSGQ